MIEVLNIQPINKGSLLATCDVHVKPWKYTFHEVKIFQKGESRWIALATNQRVTKTGEIEHKKTGSFDNETVHNSFRNQVMAVIDKYLLENPNLEPEAAVKEDDLCPF